MPKQRKTTTTANAPRDAARRILKAELTDELVGIKLTITDHDQYGNSEQSFPVETHKNKRPARYRIEKNHRLKPPQQPVIRFAPKVAA